MASALGLLPFLQWKYRARSKHFLLNETSSEQSSKNLASLLLIYHIITAFPFCHFCSLRAPRWGSYTDPLVMNKSSASGFLKRIKILFCFSFEFQNRLGLSILHLVPFFPIFLRLLRTFLFCLCLPTGKELFPCLTYILPSFLSSVL